MVVYLCCPSKKRRHIGIALSFSLSVRRSVSLSVALLVHHKELSLAITLPSSKFHIVLLIKLWQHNKCSTKHTFNLHCTCILWLVLWWCFFYDMCSMKMCEHNDKLHMMHMIFTRFSCKLLVIYNEWKKNVNP